ncbi:NAD(P)-binding protein [Polyplosphaeria fusca]|uniref:NAD(P)-binding protein n=1 Tax=Polyplosphaeria fusca TaxID=682080 RepID=A0A9P4R6A8_9PLEO|nr:NAD(P)-binding protein [Polyplosphaeria fusca]
MATSIPGPYRTTKPHSEAIAEIRLQRWSAKNPPADPQVTFAGKTILVTGANTGLGYESALKYAQKGATKLVLGVRTIEKGNAARQSIMQQSSMQEKDIVILLVDLEEWDSVNRFTKNLEQEVGDGGLDIALLNAGLCNMSYVRASTGHEIAVQVNILSTTLMGIQILPLLRRTARNKGTPTHITITNSWAHTTVERGWWSGPILAALDNEDICFKDKGIDLRKHYCLVKLAGIAGMKRIAAAALDSNGRPEVIVNAVCPFFTKTDLARNATFAQKVAMSVMYYFVGRSAEEGGRALVGASALDPSSHGKFWLFDGLYP